MPQPDGRGVPFLPLTTVNTAGGPVTGQRRLLPSDSKPAGRMEVRPKAAQSRTRTCVTILTVLRAGRVSKAQRSVFSPSSVVNTGLTALAPEPVRS